VQNKINSGQVHPQQLDTLVEATHKEQEAYINSLIARRMESAPAGSASIVPAPADGGAAPTVAPPMTSFKSIASATMQRIRDAEGAQQ
jgi:hypothetical protein